MKIESQGRTPRVVELEEKGGNLTRAWAVPSNFGSKVLQPFVVGPFGELVNDGLETRLREGGILKGEQSAAAMDSGNSVLLVHGSTRDIHRYAIPP
jgi:hypothetical protein